MKKPFIKTACSAIVIFSCIITNAQEAAPKKPVLAAWEGMAVAGYVDKGSFVNFGGPTVKLVKKPWTIGFGILPTMRIKEDKVAKDVKKNSIITPTAGFGFTFGYKHLVVQVPFYYNAKTAVKNGQWNPGLGIGYKF
jgi:hypothetical protein